MLDFAIFAVTFLLALVAAVLYLYPVTADLGLGLRLRRVDADVDLGGPPGGWGGMGWRALPGGSRGSSPRACALSNRE